MTSRTLMIVIAWAQANNKVLRLRVIPGVASPDYVKQIGGKPIEIWDHQRMKVATVGRFWTKNYQDRWQALQKALAEKYDKNPFLGEVNISGMGIISAEPFLVMQKHVVPGQTFTNGEKYKAAGMTESLRRSALTADIAFMQDTWRYTRSTLWVHPYQAFNNEAPSGLGPAKDISLWAFNRRPGQTSFGHTGANKGVVDGVYRTQTLQEKSRERCEVFSLAL